MNVALTIDQQELHKRALLLCGQHRKIESEILEVLQSIDQTKLYKKIGHSSLFTYVVEALGLSESSAYSFISVSRKSAEIPHLKNAIVQQKLSVAKASRLVSVLTTENAKSLIEFASNHSTRKTESEVAKIRPQARAPDRTKVISDSLFKIEICARKETLAKLQRVQSLLASRSKPNQPIGFDQALDAALSEYLFRYDPVKKAERALSKGKKKSKLCALRKNPPFLKLNKRVPLTAEEKHRVYHRDGGQCTYVDSLGKRCPSDRYLHIHHLKPVSQGGSNDPKNLSTLCSFHHDLTHQLSLPLDGQVTWLRERRVTYGMSLFAEMIPQN